LRASALGSRARAASLIAQFIGTRATSLIVQFLEAQAEFDPKQAREREPVALSLDELNEKLQDSCGGRDAVLRASPLISDRHKKNIPDCRTNAACTPVLPQPDLTVSLATGDSQQEATQQCPVLELPFQQVSLDSNIWFRKENCILQKRQRSFYHCVRPTLQVELRFQHIART